MEAINSNNTATVVRNRRQKNASNNSGLEETLTLRDILDTFVANWIWFLLSVIICLALAKLYLATKPFIYQRQAVMLVKDDNGQSGRRSNIGTDALMQLNGVLSGASVKNEIYILHSFQLAQEVAKNLNLDVMYNIRIGLRNVSLYDNRPFTVEFITDFEVPATFMFTIDSKRGGTISDVKFGVPMEESDFKAKVEWGKVTKTPFGDFVATPNEKYLEQAVGSTIEVRRISVENAAIMLYNKVSSGEIDKESTLVRITCTDTNIQRADDILNGLLDAYKRSIIEDKNQIANSTSKFIEDRIDLIHKELNDVEGQMADFKQNSGLVDIKASSDAYITQSNSARQRTVQAETQYSMVQYLVDYLSQNVAAGGLIPTMGGISDPGITSQISNYNQMMLNRNRLAENTSENSPTIVDLDKNLEQMKTAILASLKGYSASLKLQVDRARREEAGLTAGLHAVPQKEKKVIDIARQQSIKETLYTYLLNKREETALQLAITEANIRVVEQPFGNRSPIAPRTKVILGIAFIIGILVPFLYFQLRKLFDTTVHGRKDVEKYTTIPILGEVPHSQVGIRDSEIIVEEDKDDILSEAFRLIRFNMPFINKDARVIMLTSTMPGEGKTFISGNFAATLGLTGKKVVLIDADIRKRTRSRLSEVAGNLGLTSYLSDAFDDVFSLVVPKSEKCNLDILPAGIAAPNPTELLMSPRLEKCIEELKTRYDYVVIDNVPAQVVADAGIVNRVVDLTIYVLRETKVDRRYLPELERLHQEKKFNHLCIVINDSRGKSKRYGYGYGYSYGYGYGYGYGREEKKKSLWKRFKKLFRRNKRRRR